MLRLRIKWLVCWMGWLCGGSLHGLSAPSFGEKALQSAAEYSRTTGETALIIFQNNKVIFEHYAEGMLRNKRVHTQSIAKPIWAMAMLRAEKKGWVSLNEKPVSSEWAMRPEKKKISPEQLLQMTSGIASHANLYRKTKTSVRKVALDQLVEWEPGTTFYYSAASYEILAHWFTEKLALHHQTPEGFLWKEILKPLRISKPSLRQDGVGNIYFSAGMELSPEELLRLGKMLLKKHWLYSSSEANPIFAYGIWLNHNAQNNNAFEVFIEDWLGNSVHHDWNRAALSFHAPSDMLTLLGSYGQRVYASQSQQFVIIRLGTGKAFRDAEFWRYLSGN